MACFIQTGGLPGVGAVCCLILVAVILGGLWLGTKDWDSDRYNAKMERFELNESLAIRLYDMIEEKPVKEVVEFIEETGIPKWKEKYRFGKRNK